MDIEGEAENAYEAVLDLDNDELIAQQFTATMTASNVNNTCHGAVRMQLL